VTGATGISSSAAILNVGDEVVRGEIANTNARWLGRELERLGVRVGIVAALPDHIESISSFVRWARQVHNLVVVTGGLGTTPDDVTREAIADAFDVGRVLDQNLASTLERSGGYAAVFAAEWSRLPEGSVLLPSVAGGAPAFAIGNVYVLAGLPSEMRATFKAMRADLQFGPAHQTWRRTYRTTEDRIISLLAQLNEKYSEVVFGSYPHFGRSGAEVEVVLRASQHEVLTSAALDLEAAFERLGVASHDA
jgi:nicotinamide-nucleotide amidase